MKTTYAIFISKIILIFYLKVYEAQRTYLDELTPLNRLLKDITLKIFSSTSQDPRNLRLADNLHKLQPRVNENVPFPCNTKNMRSRKRPESVHRLRPGDIDIVGALGDSLTAGNGLAASNLLHVLVENRGIAFSIGGQGTWRQFVTLPNILKEFNPNLFGYSSRDSFGHHKAAEFNAAEAFGFSRDIPYMAAILINRIKNDPRVDIKNHWKMISILIGANDFCSDMCYYKQPEQILEAHRNDLKIVLRLLRDNLPRTIVNVVITPNVKVLANVTLQNRPPICYVAHNVECPCIFGLQFRQHQARFYNVMSMWQKVEMEVASDPEFDREDFTVVAQPFTINYTLHYGFNGLTDYSSLSADCFHLSQKEGARAALSLWNNILEPIGKKSATASELYNFKCPKNSQPFIFTRRNSPYA